MPSVQAQRINPHLITMTLVAMGVSLRAANVGIQSVITTTTTTTVAA